MVKTMFRKTDNLRKYSKKWVAKNLGQEYVNEFLEKYDRLNSGMPIGGFVETAIFVDMIQKIKKERETDECYRKTAG